MTDPPPTQTGVNQPHCLTHNCLSATMVDLSSIQTVIYQPHCPTQTIVY